MRIRVDGTRIVGQAVDLRDTGIEPDRILDGIRIESDPLVESPPPTEVHRHVGAIRRGMGLDVREALVTAGRSLGLESPYDDEIDEIDHRLAEMQTEHPDLQQARKRAASAGESVEALRERVARLSGRLNALRENGDETDAVEASLRAATRELSEAETEAIAANQALATAEREARRIRDKNAARLSLEDRRENLRRDARSWLVEQLVPPLQNAMASLPVDPLGVDSPLDAGSYPGPRSHLALGIARIADISAPIVLIDSPFATALRARAALSAPVILA